MYCISNRQLADILCHIRQAYQLMLFTLYGHARCGPIIPCVPVDPYRPSLNPWIVSHEIFAKKHRFF